LPPTAQKSFDELLENFEGDELEEGRSGEFFFEFLLPVNGNRRQEVVAFDALVSREI
jgi:hypothetical protein